MKVVGGKAPHLSGAPWRQNGAYWSRAPKSYLNIIDWLICLPTLCLDRIYCSLMCFVTRQPGPKFQMYLKSNSSRKMDGSNRSVLHLQNSESLKNNRRPSSVCPPT